MCCIKHVLPGCGLCLVLVSLSALSVADSHLTLQHRPVTSCLTAVFYSRIDSIMTGYNRPDNISMDLSDNLSGPPSPGSVCTPPPDDSSLENPISLLDAAYMDNAIQVANGLVQSNVHYWMAKYSECALLLNNIKGLLALYNAGEIHQTLCDMLDTMPTASTPPPVPQLLLHIPFPEQQRKKRKISISPVDVYNEMKAAYDHKPPSVDKMEVVSPPDSSHDMELTDLEACITKCQEIVKEVDNVTLYNAANYGHWLEIAFKKFQLDKKSGKIVLKDFATWIEQKCGVSYRWVVELRHFYYLANQYPQILFCRLSLSFFKCNRKAILSYFECDQACAAGWKHAITCPCQHCGPM